MSSFFLKNIEDPDGSLIPIEFKDLPFIPKRIFIVSNVPKNAERGQHAHFETQQILICLKGKILVKLYNGKSLDEFHLNEKEGIFVDKMIWDSQVFLTGDDILLSICSTNYDKKDYIENMKEFEEIINGIKK